MPDPRPLPKISKVDAPGQGQVLSILAGQYGQSKYDVGQSPYQQDNLMANRAQQQSNWRAMANSLQQSVVGEILGGALQGAGSIVDAVTGTDYQNPGMLCQWGSDLQESMREKAPIYVDPNRDGPGNMEWWIKGLPNLATTAAMLIPGLGVAKGVGMVGKALRASELAISLSERGLGALAMRHAENYMEAFQNRKQVYDDLLGRGYDADKASIAADYAGALTYKMNYGNLLFDFIQLSAIMKPLKGVKFTQGKDLGVIDRMKAVNEAGYKVANRAVKDFGATGIMDGLKWWEKSLVYGTRYASPVIAQGSEGIEELVNNFSQQEGVYQANKIAKGEQPDKPIWEGGDTEFFDRAKDSVFSKSGKESFFWGVMGGVAFNKVGSLMNMAMDKEHRSQQAMQIANLDNRKNVIASTLKTLADPEATASEKREAQFSSVFDLARNSVISGNDEVLIDALNSPEYRKILQQESGITDETLFQKKIDEIAEDVRFIQDSYSKFVGKDMKAVNQEIEKSNFNMFSAKEKDALGESEEIHELATPENLYFNWLSNSRQATDYMVQLDYFAHKNDQLNKETNFELEKLLNETFGDMSMEQKNAAKAYYRKLGVDANIKHQESQLKQAKKAGVSKDKVDQIDANLKTLKDISQRYDKIYKEQLDVMREAAATKIFGEGDYSEKTDAEKEFSAALAEGDFIVKRDSIVKDAERMNFNVVNRNVDKQVYAQERAKAINDPVAWHREYADNNTRIQAFLQEEKRLAIEFGILPTDSQEVRDFKIEIGTLAKSEDPESEAMKSYRNHYGNYSQYTNEDQFNSTAAAIQAELDKFDFSKPGEFDKTTYLKLKGQQRALMQARAEFNERQKAATAAAAAPSATGTTTVSPSTGGVTKVPGKVDPNHTNFKKLIGLNEFSISVFGMGQPNLEPYDAATDLRVDSYMVVAKEDYELMQKFKLAHPEHFNDIVRLLEIANLNGVVDSTGEPVSLTHFKFDETEIPIIVTADGKRKLDMATAIKKPFLPVLDHIQELKDKGQLDQNPDMKLFDSLFNRSFSGLTNPAFALRYDTMQNSLESLIKLNAFNPKELIDMYTTEDIKSEIAQTFDKLPMENYQDFFDNAVEARQRLTNIYKQLNNVDVVLKEDTVAPIYAPVLNKDEQVIVGEVEPLNDDNLNATEQENGLTTEQIIEKQAGDASTQIEKMVTNGKPVINDNTQIRIEGLYSIFSKLDKGRPAEWTDGKFKLPLLRPDNELDFYNFDKWGHVGSPYYLQPDDNIKLVRTGKMRSKNLKGLVTEEYESVEIYKVADDGVEVFLGYLPYMTDIEHREKGWGIPQGEKRDAVRDLYVNIRKAFPESGILNAKASPMKIGDLIFNHSEAIDPEGKKRVYDYGSLSESFQLENINQRYDKTKSNVYLTIMRAVGVDKAALSVMRGAKYETFDKTPNGENIHIIVRDEYNKKKYVGQSFALVPTNTIYQGKHVYYAVLVGGRRLGDFNPVAGKYKNKNIVESIIEAVLKPADNDALIRELSSKIGGFGFKPNIPVIDQPKALVDFYELVPTIIGKIVYANIQPSEHGSAHEYTYPFRFTYINPETIKKNMERDPAMKKKMEIGGIVNKYGSFVMEIGGGEKAFQAVGQVTNAKWTEIAAKAKPILDNKPLRVDNSYISHNVNSGPYSIPFFNKEGDLVVEEFPSYLHYLDEKKALASIVQGVDINGKRFYFTPGTPYMRGVSEGQAQNYNPAPAVVKVKPEDENPLNSLFGEKPTFEQGVANASKQAQEEKKEEIKATAPEITLQPIEVIVTPTATEPAAKQPEPVNDVISEADYKKFIDFGVVSEALLKTIADKVKNQQQLSPRELEIFTDKTSYINKIIAADQAQTVKDLITEKEEIEKAIANDKKRKDAEKVVTAAMEDLTTEEKDTIALVFDQNKKPDESLESFVATAVVNEQNNRAPYKGDKGIIAKFREILRKIMKTFLLIGAISSVYIGSSSLVVPSNIKISPPTGVHIDLSSPGSIQTTIGEYHQGMYKNTPYSILDKKTREMYVYDSSGVMIYKGPALMGATEGKDTLTTGTMKQFWEFTEKVTPTGEFKLHREADSSYGAKYSFFLTDPDGKYVKPSPSFAVAFHSTSQLPDRLAALATGDPGDNAISFGCVAVGKSDFTQLEGKMGEGAHIYILPDNSNRALYESFLKERYTNPKLTFKQFLEKITKPAEQVPGKENLPLEASMLASLLAVIRKRRGEGATFTDEDIAELEKRLKEINDQLAAQPKQSDETIDKNEFYKSMAESNKAVQPETKEQPEEELPFDPNKMFRNPTETDMVPTSNQLTVVEKFMDPYMFKHQPATYNKLTGVATNVLFDVLHAQTGDEIHLNKQTLKNRSIERLRDLITKNRTYLQTVAKDWKTDADPDKRAQYAEAETALEYLKYLNSTFDKDFMPSSVKPLIGKFEGYFNLAFDRLFAYKVVRFSHYVDNVVIEDEGYAKRVRHDDNWSAYINPKDTVLFRAKVFLSRIPMREPNGNIKYNEFGMPVYHSLEQMYNNIFAQPDKIRPRDIAEHLLDDQQTNPVLKSIGLTLEEYKETHPHLYESMFNMLASSLLLQRRDMMVSSAKTNEDGGLDVYLYNLNRQQLEEQLLNVWDENFKTLMPSYYNIEQEMDKESGVVVTKIPSLKEKELSVFTTSTKPIEVDYVSFIDPGKVLEEDFNNDEINHTEFEDRRADYKMEFLLRYFQQLQKLINNTQGKAQLHIPSSVTLSNNVTVSKEDIATLLRYINIPSNIEVDGYTASVIKPKEGEGSEMYQTKLGSVLQGLEDVLKTPSVRNVSPQALFIAGHLMDRLGLQPNQDFKQSGRSLYELSKNYGAMKAIDSKNAPNLKQILTSKVVKGIGTRLIKPDAIADGKTEFKWLADSMENPFGRDRIAMRDLAKGLKSWWPGLVSINIVNNDGENEYTVNYHTALSNMVARIRYDAEYRNSLLNNPFIKNNPFLKNMIDPEGDLNEFALQYNAGFKIGQKSYNVKSVNEYIYPAMAYTFFQHGESAGTAGVRTTGRFLTQHGESHVTPSIRARKVQVDIKFREDESGKIRIVTRPEMEGNSPFFDSVAGAFRNELNRVYTAQRIYEATQKILADLVEKQPNVPRADLVREAGLLATKRHNAQEGYNFHIKGEKLIPGAAMKFIYFGKEMFNDTKKVIYGEDGLLKPEFIVNDTVDANKATDRMLNAYLDDFLTEMVDNFIDSQKDIEMYTLQETTDEIEENVRNLKYVYPLFDRKYVEHMRNLLKGRIHLSTKLSANNLLEIEQWNKDEMKRVNLGNSSYSYNVTDSTEDIARDKADAQKYLQYEYRYLMADFLLNNFLFKTSYYQLMQDPATFQKSATYEDIKVESDKRLKHHLGPGSMTSLRPTRVDDMRVVYKLDTYVHDMKVPVNEVAVSRMQPHQKKALAYMEKAFKQEGYFAKKGNTYYLPTQFGTLAAIWFAHRNSKDLKKILDAYLTQRVDDGGAEITPREFLGRYVRTGEIERTDAVRYLRVLEDPNSTTEQLIALRNEMPVTIMKMIYSDQNDTGMKDPVTGKLQQIQMFTVLKNSESVMTPALVKGTEKFKIYQDLIKVEKSVLAAEGLGEDSFEFGIVHAPISNSKSAHPVALKTWNPDGSYNGSVIRSYVQRLNREGLREQQDSVLKEDNKITQSSQAIPFSLLNVSSDMYFGEDLGQLKLKLDEMIMGEGMTSEQYVDKKDGMSNVQVSNARVEIYDAQIRQDWMDVVSELGLAQNMGKNEKSASRREGFMKGLYIRDAKKFLKVIGDQMISQFGANEGVFPYLETVIEKDAIMRIPISETAFGKLAENVIMAKLGRIVSGRKTEGIPLIQATSSGYHVYDKAAGQIKEGTDLMGYDIETKVLDRRFTSRRAAELAYPHNLYDVEVVEETSGVQSFKPIIYNIKPAEVDISWNFRGPDGKLLNYDEYVNKDGTPKLNKFTDEMLEAIGYRIPNTGANTISYLKVRKFLAPSHADMIRVPPMLLTMMNADLDVDKLYMYTKTYEVKEGKIQHIESVIHDSQENASAIIYTEENKKEFVNRYLKTNNQEYRALVEQVANLTLDNKIIRRAMERLGENYTELTEDLKVIRTTTEEQFQQMSDQFPALKEQRKSLKKMIATFNLALAGNETVLEQMLEQVPEDYPGGIDDKANVRRFKDAVRDDLIKHVLPELEKVEETIKSIQAKAKTFGLAEDPRYRGLLESVDTTELDKASARMKEIFDAQYKNFDFTKGGLAKKGFSFYDVMSADQLQNAMMDTFKMMFSSGSMLKKMTAPLNSDPIKNLAQDESVVYYNDDGEVVKTSLNKFNKISQGFINDAGSAINSKLGNKDNSDMIGIMASAMRTLSLAQRHAFYLTSSERIPDGLLYGEVEKNADGVYETKRVGSTPLIHGEDKLTPGNSFYINGAVSYENKNEIYAGRMRHVDNGRYRLDAFVGKDIHGDEYEIPVVIAGALQAALDGVKEVVNGFINLNPDTVNAFMVHVMLRHVDEGARILNTKIIKRYVREVLADKPDAELGRTGRMKEFVSKLALSSGIISAKGIDEIVNEFPSLDALGFASKILKSANYKREMKTLSVADLNRHLGQDLGDVTEDAAYKKREFLILYNFMTADDIGNQLLTVNQTLNTFNKGSDNNITDVLDKKEAYQDLHRLSYNAAKPGKNKWEFTTTVPNIGGIYRLNEQFSKTSADESGLKYVKSMEVAAHETLTSFVDSVFGSNENIVFLQGTKMFRTLTDRVLRALPPQHQNSKMKRKLHLEFTSFMNSNPELYRQMFTEDAEFEFFKENGMAQMLKSKWVSEEAQKAISFNNDVFIDDTLGTADLITSLKEDYGNIFPVLNSLKTRKGTAGNPDNIMYMNIANLGDRVALTYAQNISAMFDYQAQSNASQKLKDEAKLIRALARQIVLVSMNTHGGINSPNSLVRHIDPTLHYGYGFDVVKRAMLDRLKSESNKDYLRNVADSFGMQFVQHYPYYAFKYGTSMYQKSIPDSSPQRKTIRYNEDEHRYEIHLREFAAPEFRRLRIINFEGRLFKYEMKDNIHKLVEVDKLGNAQFNQKEYRWNDSRTPGQSLINSNISSTNRKYKDPGSGDEGVGPGKDLVSYGQELKDMFSTGQSSMNELFEAYLKGHDATDNMSLAEMVMENYFNLISNNASTLDFNPVVKFYNNPNDTNRATLEDDYSASPNTFVISFNEAKFIKDGVVLTSEFDESVGHEFTHMFLREAMKEVIGRKAGVSINPIIMSDTARNSLIDKFNDLAKMYMAVKKATTTAGNDLYYMNNSYKDARRTGNVVELERLRAMRIFEIDADIVGYLSEKPEVMNNWEKLTLVYQALADYYAYARTNEAFQRALNETNISQLDAALAEKVGDKSFWQWIKDFVNDVVDALLNIADLQKMTPLEIKNRSLLHASLSAMHEVFNPAARLMLEKRMTATRSRSLEGIVEQEEKPRVVIQTVPETVNREKAARDREILYIVSTTPTDYNTSYKAENIVNLEVFPEVGINYRYDTAEEMDAFRARTAKSIAAIKKQIEKGKYKAVFMSSLFSFGESPNPVKYQSLRDEYKAIVAEEIKKADIDVTFNPGGETDMVPALFDEVYEGAKNYSTLWSGELKNIYNNLVLENKIIC